MIPYQYLLNSHTNYTITNLANHLENVSHDTINRYLKIENFDDQDLWKNVQEEIETDIEGYLIFDDTVLHKEHGSKIELVRRQYSGIGA